MGPVLWEWEGSEWSWGSGLPWGSGVPFCPEGGSFGSGALAFWGSGTRVAFRHPAEIWPRYYRLWADTADAAQAKQPSQPGVAGFLPSKEVIVEYDPLCAGAAVLVWRSHDWLSGGGDWRLTVQRSDKLVTATLQVQNVPGLSFKEPFKWATERWDFFGRNDLQPVQPAQLLGFLASIAMEPE